MAYAKPLFRREDIINNWRSSHSFPLNAFHITLRQRAKKIDPSALTAQRLKRLPSIAAKLERFPEMKLSQMQDLGGCRAVVKGIAEVEKLVDSYKRARAKNPKARHEFLHIKDYITEPKDDGYRSYHMIYRYRSRARKHQPYNGLKIEIQIRTKLQHAWATAVEIISTFTGQALKSNIGDESWKRFFKLMSCHLARREGRPGVPDTPENHDALARELRDLVNQLQVKDVLTGWGAGVNFVDDFPKGTKNQKKVHAYLMSLDAKEKRLKVRGFTVEQLPQAQLAYLNTEKENVDKPWIQSVLVSVDSLKALRRAYPNFYLDSAAFTAAVEEATADKTNGKKPQRI